MPEADAPDSDGSNLSALSAHVDTLVNFATGPRDFILSRVWETVVGGILSLATYGMLVAQDLFAPFELLFNSATSGVVWYADTMTSAFAFAAAAYVNILRSIALTGGPAAPFILFALYAGTAAVLYLLLMRVVLPLIPYVGQIYNGIRG